MQALIDAGRTGAAGNQRQSAARAVCRRRVGIIMDIKCPDSGMAAHNLPDNYRPAEGTEPTGLPG